MAISKGNSGKPKSPPPDGGWGWMVVVGVSLVNLSTRPIEPSFGLLFGDILEKLSIATTGAGIIVSAYEAIINFSGLFVGPLIKKYSYRKVAMFGSVLTAFGLISTYPAASMTHIICTYSIINGLGIGFSSSATFVSLNHYFKKRRGQAVGITMTGTGLGLLLMPQAVRYLTEEYDFAGSILILGAFALNACVGACLLQPIKWHLKKPTPEQGDLLTAKEKEMNGNCPHITITHTISEKDEDSEENENEPEEKKEDPIAKERMISNQRKWSMISRQNSLIGRITDVDSMKNTINKSSTETKLDKYFEDGIKRPYTGRRKLSEISYNNAIHKSCTVNVNDTSNNSINKVPEPIAPNLVSTSSVRRRKGSTISNLSNLDFHGSCLQIHAIKHEIETEKEPKPTATTDVENKPSLWSRFSTFMDLDLLKDPVFLNILFGVSIFYVAELNFKMVVPFFLADLGHSKSETAFCLSMMAASDIVARVVLPPICDRISITRRTMFMSGAIFCAISRSALAEVGDWIQLETILIISGFFRGATLINFMLVISEYCDERMDKLPAAFGLHMVAKGIFIAAFGPLIGLIRDTTGSFPLCIHAQSVCILLCALAWSIEYLIVYFKGPKDKNIT